MMRWLNSIRILNEIWGSCHIEDMWRAPWMTHAVWKDTDITRFLSSDKNEQTLSLNLSGKFRALLKFLTQMWCIKVGKDVNESKFQIHYNGHLKDVRTKINYVRTGCARSLPEVSAVVKVDTAGYFTESFFLLCSHWSQPENQGLSLAGKFLKTSVGSLKINLSR